MMFTQHIDTNTALRPITLKDAHAFFNIVQSCRAYLNQWVPWATVDTLKDMQFLIQNRISQTNHLGQQFCMLYKYQVVGWIGFTHLNWQEKSIEIEYWIGQSFQGHGTTTKCCAYLTQYAFNFLDINKVIICTAEANTKSQNIPLHLGFLKERILPNADTLHGHLINLVLFSKEKP